MQNLALSSQFSNSGRRGSSSSNSFQSLVMNGVLPPSDDGRVEGLAATPPPRGYTADGKPFFGGELDEPFNPGADIDWGFGGSSTGWTPPDIVNPFDPNNRNNNNNNNNNPPDIADRRNNSGNPHNPNTPESPAGDNLGKGVVNNNVNQNNIVSGQAYYTTDKHGNRIWVLPGQGHWILDWMGRIVGWVSYRKKDNSNNNNTNRKDQNTKPAWDRRYEISPDEFSYPWEDSRYKDKDGVVHHPLDLIKDLSGTFSDSSIENAIVFAIQDEYRRLGIPFDEKATKKLIETLGFLANNLKSVLKLLFLRYELNTDFKPKQEAINSGEEFLVDEHDYMLKNAEKVIINDYVSYDLKVSYSGIGEYAYTTFILRIYASGKLIATISKKFPGFIPIE